MDITTELAQVRSKLGSEILPEVEKLIVEIETKVTDNQTVLDDNKEEVLELQKARKKVNYESRERRIELNKVNLLNEDLTTENDGLKKNVGSEKEIEGLRDFKKGIIAKNRKGFVDSFANVVKHKNFENVKSEFVLPECKDGKYDFEKTSDDDMDSNVVAFDRLNRIKYFGDQSEKKDVHGKITDGNPEDWKTKVDKAKTVEELQVMADQL